MKIIISGGTGLIGRELVPQLLQFKHELFVIGRNKEKINTIFHNTVTAIDWDGLPTLNPDEFDIIINLAGENIAEHRWSASIKEKLMSSRIESTQNLIDWAKNSSVKKPHLYNASAIGIYGLQDTSPAEHEAFTELDTSSKQLGFAKELVSQWEETAVKGGLQAQIPVTLMRFAVVIKQSEGMLKKLELPTKYGLGAIVGTGEQPISWIDYTDLINAIIFLINHPEITGAVNMVAPQFVSQKAFMQTLAKVLNRPLFLRLPAWFVKFMFGQMGEELLLAGQAVAPKRLLENQFNFQYPTLLEALKKEVS